MATSNNFLAQSKIAIATLVDPQLAANDVNLTNCDREPIHMPGAIQPHGVLLTFSAHDLILLQVSQNSASLLNRSPEQLLGQPLTAVLDSFQIAALQNCLASAFEMPNPLRWEVQLEGQAQPVEAIVHSIDDVIVLELEPSELHQSVNFFDFYHQVKAPLDRLRHTKNLEALCQTLAQEIKTLTGYDRVMIYRFEDDGSGSIVAEVAHAGLEPYLGLRYPATDIPKQARLLYQLNGLRMIPDATYEPVPLVPQLNPLTQAPLDMSLATLRSVSPLHREYLKNMGVRASLSVSLMCGQTFWGLIACHHDEPRRISYELRTLCEFMGQMASFELAAKVETQDLDYHMSLKAIQARFVERFSEQASLRHQFLTHSQDLLALVGAQGAALVEQTEMITTGTTPTQAEIRTMLPWIDEQLGEDAVYATYHLARDYPKAEPFCKTASGILALAISKIHKLYILWFRPEILSWVRWAGNPQKAIAVDADGNALISPRKSFALWQETVRHQSLPWKACEVEAALELRNSVISVVLQKADELAAVNLELERSNNELDSFAYIASHDLKEPLRGIHNYSSFLLEDYQDLLPEDGVSKLQTLMRLTQRMEDLINSLLHYSRLGRVDLWLSPVDLNQLLDSVMDIIHTSQPGAITLRVPRPLPTIDCDRTQIQELFTNLISNSIKYNDNPEKWVEIGYLEATDLPPDRQTELSVTEHPIPPIFYVRDNGIGIRQQHQEAVFRIFKRLHGPNKYGGGTGAGLTIVKKIVERHGGTLWLESVYGEGSTFYFTLQK